MYISHLSSYLVLQMFVNNIKNNYHVNHFHPEVLWFIFYRKIKVPINPQRKYEKELNCSTDEMEQCKAQLGKHIIKYAYLRRPENSIITLLHHAMESHYNKVDLQQIITKDNPITFQDIGEVTTVRLSCYLVLLSNDSKTR